MDLDVQALAQDGPCVYGPRDHDCGHDGKQYDVHHGGGHDDHGGGHYGKQYDYLDDYHDYYDDPHIGNNDEAHVLIVHIYEELQDECEY